jgi:predicted RNase H-like HicB family nuclease
LFGNADLPKILKPGRKETRENLKEAIRLVLEANRELAQRETQGRDVVRESIVVSL